MHLLKHFKLRSPWKKRSVWHQLAPPGVYQTTNLWLVLLA